MLLMYKYIIFENTYITNRDRFDLHYIYIFATQDK